jgi:hypothetical protein
MSQLFKATLEAGIPIPGPAGPQGPQGDPGPAGPQGAAFTRVHYRADTSTTQASDPGTGLLRWNAAAVEDVTVLYFDRLSQDGDDVTLMFTLANPQRIVVQEAAMHLNQQNWIVTGPMVEMADWFQIPVAVDVTRGTPFKPQNQTPLLVLLLGA